MRTHIPTTALAHAAMLAALSFLVAGCGGATEVAAQDESASPSSSPSPDSGASSSAGSDGSAPSDDSGGDGTGHDDASNDDPAEIELTIELSLDSEGEPVLEGFSPGTWTLTCSPAGGDHPEPEAACADLSDAGTEVFEPVPESQPCTFVYGGPEVATVTGRVGDTEVDSTFRRSDGCEVDRWEQPGALLTPQN
ncbi:SSI family serine proteinase inhibitor [Marinactinospora rubrisoli]|uniref:SSI family serine proteinase inhibitor n=1 Tax=Marinactinospora rubrisoli TaxID=2715399 RepID=A0ABW2K9Q6_9ACTN